MTKFCIVEIIGFMVASILLNIHRGCLRNHINFCDYLDYMLEHIVTRVNSMFDAVRMIINPCTVLLLFSDLLAYIFYYDKWIVLTIKTGINVLILILD